MVDQALLDKMKSIVEDPSEATIDDMSTLLEFAKQISRENDNIKEQLGSVNTCVEMVISDKDAKFWIKVSDGVVDVGQGDADDPSFTFSASFETGIGLLTGETDPVPAFIDGKIKIESEGQDYIKDAMTFQNLIELVLDAYEDLTE
ncbi:MAG: SCP2 sterol-binding domain-containing protein [Promethearchaeota archaeon]